MRLSALYARNAIISLLTHWPSGAAPSLSLTALGGPAGLLKTLRLIGKQHLCQPIPILELGRLAPEGSFLHILWGNLRGLCGGLDDSGVRGKKRSLEQSIKGDEPRTTHAQTPTTPIKGDELVQLLLEESGRLLRKAARFSSSKVKRAESEHPYSGDASPRNLSVPGATGLIITFDRHSRFTDSDTLLLSLDEKQTRPLRRFSGNALNQFHPVVVPSDGFWLQLKRAQGILHNDPIWGFRLTVTPTTDKLNLALWIAEFLVEECVQVSTGKNSLSLSFSLSLSLTHLCSHLNYNICIYLGENVRGKVYAQLVEYLKASKCPETMKTVIVRLLTRISKLTYDQCVTYLLERKERKEERNESDERIRSRLLELVEVSKGLEEEMGDLLAEVNLLHSTYLQNLTELIVINRKNSINSDVLVGVLPVAPVATTPSPQPTPADNTNIKTSSGKGKGKRQKTGKEKDKEKEETRPVRPSMPDEDEALFYPLDTDGVEGGGAPSAPPSTPEALLAFTAAIEGRKIFKAIAGLDVILGCWLHHRRFPRAFISKLGWSTARAYDSLPKPYMTVRSFPLPSFFFFCRQHGLWLFFSVWQIAVSLERHSCGSSPHCIYGGVLSLRRVSTWHHVQGRTQQLTGSYFFWFPFQKI